MPAHVISTFIFAISRARTRPLLLSLFSGIGKAGKGCLAFLPLKPWQHED